MVVVRTPNRTPNTIDSGVMDDGSPAREPMRRDVPIPSIIPIRLETIPKTPASSRYCLRMSSTVAPRASMVPISLILSFTVSIITLAMPIPPTSSYMAPIPARAYLIMERVLIRVLSISRAVVAS